jgi:hypothetical protein
VHAGSQEEIPEVRNENSDAFQKNNLSPDFARNKACAARQKVRAVWWRWRLAGVFAARVKLAEKPPAGRRRHENPRA